MSRIRNIRPEFFRHEGLQDLEKQNPGKYPMFVFEGLWTKCDRQGVFEWKPRSLKLDILPFLEFDMAESLGILLKANYIKKYIVEGKEYGIILTFLKHQKISIAEQKNQNVYPLPADQHDLFDDYIETDKEPFQNGSKTVHEPFQNGSKTVHEPFQNAGNRKSEFGNLNTEIGKSDSENDFSLSQNLNPNSLDLSKRIEILGNAYNDLKIGPPFKKTALNLSSPEISDLSGTITAYPDDVSIGAMKNYKRVTTEDEFDPGSCTYKSFIGFMKNGVEKYCDEAKPFEVFKKKGTWFGQPPPSTTPSRPGKKSL